MNPKYIFGPVPSRRLGNSLGINPIPLKTCNYSCVYCQLGKTSDLKNEIKEYFPLNEIEAELVDFFQNVRNLPDYITIVGEGEPLLYSKLGELINFIKETFLPPVALITNGSLLYLKEIRDSVSDVDVILPTVDTVIPETFKKINRPHRDLKLEKILEGLLLTRKSVKGEFWAEVMLVKGLNDSEKEISALSEYFKKLKPDRIFINIPVRPPADSWVESPDISAFHIVEKYIPEAEFINFSASGIIDPEAYDSLEELIISVSRRHPISLQLLKNSVKESDEKIEKAIKKLESEEKIKLIKHGNKTFIRGLSERTKLLNR